jgi:hypothetical protein
LGAASIRRLTLAIVGVGISLIAASAPVAASITHPSSRDSAARPPGHEGRVGAIHLATTSYTALPASQVCVIKASSNCQSTDPLLTLDYYDGGNNTGCTIVDEIDWGDGSSAQDVTIYGQANAGYYFEADHTYQAEKTTTFTIADTPISVGSSCPPGVTGDTHYFTLKVATPPSVSWKSPAANSGTYHVTSGSITLAASVSSSVGIAKVTFIRWDAIAQQWVTIATVTQAPWRTSLNSSRLNGQWNQVNVQAWDTLGNASSSPFIWIYRDLPSKHRLKVPFATQMGSAGDANSGSNNCGPASITMTIRFYGGSTTVQAAAVAIRGSNSSSNGPTDFKSSMTKSFLQKFSLVERDISTWDQVRGEISGGRPVVILVNNHAYRNLKPPPYDNNNDGWFTNAHIIVVTGYDSANVYVNDPLRRSGADYAIPVATFKKAASTASGSNSSSWYAVSIARG